MSLTVASGHSNAPYGLRAGRKSVLVVEDEQDLLAIVGESLTEAGFTPTLVCTGAEALECLGKFAYDALIVDLRLPDASGMDIMSAALDRYPGLLVIMVTGFGGVDDAVTAIKRGAIDFLIKPFQLGQLSRILGAALDQQRLTAENQELRAMIQDRYRLDGIIGQSAAIRQLYQTLELVAPMNSTVLIKGETGTGKELVARTIHQNSPRASQRFVAFNAAAIPETLAEAELFGHAKGAFTGAINHRVGRFEMAHRGTLFIDEVALMPMPLQSKLLRALQEREIERVGESRPIQFDTRIIAASNLDLKTMVKDGTFREDLYYRLNVIPIQLPALRARVEDVPVLARHFVAKSCKSNGVPLKTLTQDAVRVLMNHAWPGNVRELENAIEHAVAMSGSETAIAAAALPEEVVRPSQDSLLPRVTIPDEGINFTSVVTQLERELILRVMEKTRGNKRQAARLLQLSRTTFIDKLQRLNLPADEDAGQEAATA